MFLTWVSTLYWRTSTVTKVPAVMGTVVCCSAPFMVKVMKRSPLGSIQNLTSITHVTNRYQYPEVQHPGFLSAMARKLVCPAASKELYFTCIKELSDGLDIVIQLHLERNLPLLVPGGHCVKNSVLNWN